MIQCAKAMGLLVVSVLLFATLASSQDTTDTWRGLVVAPENRCSPYDREQDYPYPQSIEQNIAMETHEPIRRHFRRGIARPAPATRSHRAP